jgi:hypothetical protein
VPLPDFNDEGDLPVGVHSASLTEVLSRFGGGTPQRREVTARLSRILEMGRRTGHVARIILFGSYITTKPDPNDIDLVVRYAR